VSGEKKSEMCFKKRRKRSKKKKGGKQRHLKKKKGDEKNNCLSQKKGTTLSERQYENRGGKEGTGPSLLGKREGKTPTLRGITCTWARKRGIASQNFRGGKWAS